MAQSTSAMAQQAHLSFDGKPDQKDSNEMQPHSHRPRKRGSVNVNGACAPCRKGKRKCDGAKPVCQACRKRVIDPKLCVYDQLEGFSRSATLKHNLESLRDERETLRVLVRDLLNIVPGPSAQGCVRNDSHYQSIFQALGDQASETLRSLHRPSSQSPEIEDHLPSPATSATPVLAEWPQPSWPPTKDGPQVSPTYSASSSTQCSPIDTRATIPKLDANNLNLVMLSSNNSQSSYSTSTGRASSVSSSNPSLYNPFFKQEMQVNRDGLARTRTTSSSKSDTPFHIQIVGLQPATMEDHTSLSDLDKDQPDVRLPSHLIQPIFLPDNNSHHFSKTIQSFLELARSRIAHGWPLENILGPIHFDVSRLFEDEGKTYRPNWDDTFSVPDWSLDVVTHCFAECGIFERLATVLYFARLMRWLLSPTQENYALMHETQRPSMTQLLIPHIAEYSFLIVPTLRDALIRRPREYIHLSGQFHVSWDRKVPFTRKDPVTDMLVVTPAFERIALDARSWGVEAEVFDAFPEMREPVKMWKNGELDNQSGTI